MDVQKIYRRMFQLKKTRQLVLTDEHLCYYKNGTVLSRQVHLSKLLAFVRQMHTNSDENPAKKTYEVVIIAKENKDFHFMGLTLHQVDELQHKLQHQFFEIDDGECQILQIFGVPDKHLKSYVNHETRYQFINLPDERYRLKTQELVRDEEDDEFDILA